MFGCGDALAPGALGFSRDVAPAAFAVRADRLRHSDFLERDAIDWAYEIRRRARSFFLGGAGLFGLVAPFMTVSSGGSAAGRDGRVHTLPSTPETVRLGVFDSNLSNVLEIDSGDVVVYPDTWSPFLNQLPPGASI